MGMRYSGESVPQPQWSLGMRVLLDNLQESRFNELLKLPLAKKGTGWAQGSWVPQSAQGPLLSPWETVGPRPRCSLSLAQDWLWSRGTE